ncbi:unnamed protein product [Periconia digitata]|uniref:Uncharacterized protein n=1 Tax=Periconia digitata TaxID=1303443 RepID=A0A9W4U674_9PLEO|nr:unnamed protein product [Periconia digitata]
MLSQLSKKFLREQGISFLAGILRLTIVYPLIEYASAAQRHWKTTKAHGILQRDGPYNHDIMDNEKLAYIWGYFAFWWYLLSWVPSILTLVPPKLIFPMIDGCIVVFISTATHAQTAYAPHSVDSCKGPGAHELQRPPGVNESFFEASARLNATVTDPFTMCKSYATEWQLGLTVCIILSIATVMKFYVCIRDTRDICLKAREENRSVREALVMSSIESLKVFPLLLFYGCVYAPFSCIFRCLPISVKSRVRFARGFTVKAGQGIVDKGQMRLEHIKKTTETSTDKAHIDLRDSQPASLADFLSVYDMLILISQDLHFVDVMNLGLVSKRVRQAVQPSDAHIQRMLHFRMYTCQSNSKSKCWICLNQTCTDCEQSRSLKQFRPFFHLDSCHPFCSSCYFSKVQRVPRTFRVSRLCKCEPAPDKPQYLRRTWYGGPSNDPPSNRIPMVTRSICQICNDLSDEELLSRREKRTVRELKEGAVDRGLKCQHCSKVLGRGVRWWICKCCAKECRSFYHGAWGKWGKGGGNGDVTDTHDSV